MRDLCRPEVGPSHAPCALGDVETRTFGGAKRFVAKLGISNVSIANDDQHLASNSEHVKPMMRKTGCVLHGVGPFAPSKDPRHAKPRRPPPRRSDKSCALHRLQARAKQTSSPQIHCPKHCLARA